MALGLFSGFLIVFAVIGGLELFDRTSFATIALAAKGHPHGTWGGAAGAFVLTSMISVTIGYALVAALGPGNLGLLRVGSGVFLIAYAAWVYFHLEEEESPPLRTDARSSFVTAFVTIALLELGDTTMIFMILFVPVWGPWIVLAAGAAALVLVASWNVVIGRALGARLSPRLLNRVVVGVLAVVGAFTIAYGLAPGLFPTLG